MLACFDPGAGPSEAGAVGEVYSGQVERPTVDTGEGQRRLERLAGLVVGGGDGRRGAGQQRQPRRQRGDPLLAHRGDVRSRLLVAAGVNGGLDKVHGDPDACGTYEANVPGGLMAAACR